MLLWHFLCTRTSSLCPRLSLQQQLVGFRTLDNGQRTRAESSKKSGKRHPQHSWAYSVPAYCKPLAEQ